MNFELKNKLLPENLISREMTAASLPGLGVVVIEAGDIAWQQTYGVRSVEIDTPVTPALL